MKIIEHRWKATEYHDLTEIEELYQNLIIAAMEKTSESYSPYSGFAVGASVLLEDGSCIAGTNQENASYPLCRCAESVALSTASALHPNTKIMAMAVAVFHRGQFTQEPISPCGACRQIIREQEGRYGQDIALYMYGQSKIIMIDSIQLILPLSFNENSLK